MDKNVKWAKRYTDLAQNVSTWSEDESTKVGAVIVHKERVVSVGYNGFCRGVDQTIEERHARPMKYKFFEHAERNAIFNASEDLRGSTMYLNFHPCPCSDCARAIIQSGIRTVIGPDVPFSGAGKGTHYDVEDATNIMMSEAGIERLVVKGDELVAYPVIEESSRTPLSGVDIDTLKSMRRMLFRRAELLNTRKGKNNTYRYLSVVEKMARELGVELN